MAVHLDSLSNHQVEPGQQVIATGRGFIGVRGVAVGDLWADRFDVEQDGLLLSFVCPQQPGDSSHWVVVHLADGTSSECLDENQMLHYTGALSQAEGPLRIDSITPETIAAGQEASYWLLGSGFQQVRVVTAGNHGCQFETHDDTRLMITIPALHGNEGDSIEIYVDRFDGEHGKTTFHAPLSGSSSAAGHDEPPTITSVHPDALPMAGGDLTISGSGLDDVQWVSIGTNGGEVQSRTATSIAVRFYEFAPVFEGEDVVVTVGDSQQRTAEWGPFGVGT